MQELQLTGMFTTKEDQERFDDWTKEEVYEAYLVERQARVSMNIELNKTNRRLAEIKFMAGGQVNG